MKHGRAQYELGCRCADCRAGKAATMRGYYARRRQRIAVANMGGGPRVRPEEFAPAESVVRSTCISPRIPKDSRPHPDPTGRQTGKRPS